MSNFPTRVAAAGIFLATTLSVNSVLAQEIVQAPQTQAVINISAKGNATLVPDMATVSFAVVSQADETAAALSVNSSAMQKVIDALKNAGIDAKDIQTNSFSINPLYKQVKNLNGSTQSKVIGYEVRNGLSVKVRNLANLGLVLDQSVKLGVNSGGDITFSNSDPSVAEHQARKEAVSNALSKAETLAEAANVALGDVLSISENSSMPPPVRFGSEMMMAKSMDASSVPVAAGENNYSVTVNMTIAIEQ